MRRRNNTKVKIIIALCLASFSAMYFYSWKDDVMRKIVYPLQYDYMVRQYAYEDHVDPALVAAVILVESKFNQSAASHRGASGLMQIMPDTGEWLATKVELSEPYTTESLYDPETNLRLGCWYLNFLHDRYNGQWQEALTAYIAGQGQVDRWLEDPELSSDGKTLDVIPGRDVKEYAAKVMRTHEKYKAIYPDVLVCTLDDDDIRLPE